MINLGCLSLYGLGPPGAAGFLSSVRSGYAPSVHYLLKATLDLRRRVLSAVVVGAVVCLCRRDVLQKFQSTCESLFDWVEFIAAP